LLQEGRRADAVRELQRALDLEPTSTKARAALEDARKGA